MLVTAAEITALDADLTHQIAELEAKYPDMSAEDWMPWHAHDSELSLEHWALVQRRLNLRWERPSRVLSPEQRAAMGLRLQAARETRVAQ